MDYYDTAEGFEIDERRVKRELRRHDCPMTDMADETFPKPNDRGMWDAQEVLAWLGY